MNFEKIIKPIVTEKASRLALGMKYTFWVTREATKVDIKQAFKAMYGVPATTVRMINVERKTRLAGKGRTLTKRPDMRKAIVTIAGKKGIDINKIKFEEKK